tara:strand:- start:5574 stop:9110 length:3537 start_codon:yes stop_codon:yes gene_type:complete
MPFNQNDIYTSSGTVQLFNAWTPYVSKFDTSSFYNWEQDNLPLYDLEERTYALWEQQGFATSAGVPGLALSVSANADAGTLAADRTVFTELSSCIAAIPKVVRFPVLVEVGTIGDIGNLELHNFRIEEGGSIEIINRAFGRAYDASSKITGLNNPPYNQSHTVCFRLSSIDLSSTISDASCLSIETPVLDGVSNNDVENNTHRVLYPRHTLRKAPLTVALDQNLFANPDADEFDLDPYEKQVNLSFDSTLDTLDVSSQNQRTSDRIYRSGVASSEFTGGNTYLNKLGKITVKNCDGPIYIRNFFVDAAKNTASVNDHAIEVTNSKVVLENCTGVRAKESGWKFNNSKVTLSRSAFSYRNYDLDSTTTRVAEKGFGFHAVNSEVNVSSLPLGRDFTSVGDNGASGSDCKVISSRNYAGFVLDNSKLFGGIQRSVSTDPLRGSILGSELNTGYGMILNNSEVNIKGLIDIYGNAKGIQSDSSKFTYENLCLDAHSGAAIRSRSSEFVFDSLTSPQEVGQADRHQLDMSANGQHINLQGNSLFTFRRKNNMPTTYGNSKFLQEHGAILWDGNVNAPLPAISVDDGSMLDLIHPNIQVSGVQSRPNYGSAIKASNSSKVSLFGSKSGCTFVYGPAGITYQQYMAGIYGGNNSTINLHGPTAMGQFGVDVLVEDNSVLNIEPARARDEFGLEVSGFDLSSQGNHTSVELHATRACLVANRNSTINLKDMGSFPANWARTSLGEGYLEAGSDYLIDVFETSAYTSSGSLQFYANPQDTSAIDFYNLDDLAEGLGFTLASFPKFTTLPVANRFFVTDPITTVDWTKQGNITQGGVALRATEDSVVNVKNVHFPLGTNDSPLDGFYYTTSGTECDKFMIWNIADTSRLNASYLSVSSVHPASIKYHGPSAIWASSVDQTNAGNAYDIPAYGAPSGTPGTGTLSILDVFGAGSSVWLPASGTDLNSSFSRFFPLELTTTHDAKEKLAAAGVIVSGSVDSYMIGAGPHASKNQGPFRIYWTPKSSARILQTDLSGYLKGGFPHTGAFSGTVGPAYQLFAQGYNCSASLSAIVIDDGLGNNITSGTYPDLLRMSNDTNGDGIPDQLYTSGFYYCSDMLEENPTQCILDESASRTFANAQNASVNIGGTPIKVTLVRARQNDRGSESYVGDASGSLGFKSAAIFDLSRDN